MTHASLFAHELRTTGERNLMEINRPLCVFDMAERLLMGSSKSQGAVPVKLTTTAIAPRPPPPPRPAGEQAISPQLYALIRQAIAELER